MSARTVLMNQYCEPGPVKPTVSYDKECVTAAEFDEQIKQRGLVLYNQMCCVLIHCLS